MSWHGARAAIISFFIFIFIIGLASRELFFKNQSQCRGKINSYGNLSYCIGLLFLIRETEINLLRRSSNS